jgi:glycosyltransferase involved in cell wall biosynthesis
MRRAALCTLLLTLACAFNVEVRFHQVHDGQVVAGQQHATNSLGEGLLRLAVTATTTIPEAQSGCFLQLRCQLVQNSWMTLQAPFNGESVADIVMQLVLPPAGSALAEASVHCTRQLVEQHRIPPMFLVPSGDSDGPLLDRCCAEAGPLTPQVLVHVQEAMFEVGALAWVHNRTWPVPQLPTLGGPYAQGFPLLAMHSQRATHQALQALMSEAPPSSVERSDGPLKVCFWSRGTMNGVVTGWSSVLRGWSTIPHAPQARVIFSPDPASRFQEALEHFAQTGAEIVSVVEATNGRVTIPGLPMELARNNTQHLAVVVRDAVRAFGGTHALVDVPWARSELLNRPSSFVHGSRLAEMGVGFLQAPFQQAVDATMESLCQWNAAERPWRLHGNRSPSSLLARHREWPRRLDGPYEALSQACTARGEASFLQPYSTWLAHVVLSVTRALVGCSSIVWTSDADQDAAFFGAMAAAANVPSAVADVIAVVRSSHLVPAACDSAPTAVVAWSAFTRDLVVARCVSLGHSACRGGATVMGWPGLSPREVLLAVEAHPSTLAGIPPEAAGRLSEFDFAWCADEQLPRLPYVTLSVGFDSPIAPRSRADHSARIRIGLVGRVAPEKSNLVAIQIMREALKHLPGSQALSVVVLGEGPQTGALRRFISRQVQDAERISFEWAGSLSGEALWTAVQSLDAVFFSSVRPESETFGRVPLEAMMLGVPVVAFGAGGSADFLLPNVTATLLPSLDPQESGPVLAAALRAGLLPPPPLAALFSERRAGIHWARFFACVARCDSRGIAAWTDLLFNRPEVPGSQRLLASHRLCASKCASF